MKTKLRKTAVPAVAAAIFSLMFAGSAQAHCDALDGPVITEARAALESGNVKPLLKVSVHSTTFCHPAKIRPKVTSQFPSEVTPMRKHRTPEQWQALINQQRDSGLSASKFCKQENIGYASFCNWRKRLSDQAAGDSADSGEAGFLDLSSLMGAAQSGPGWNIVLSLGNGVELRLSQNG